MLLESRRKRSLSKATSISRIDSMSSEETHLSDLVEPDCRSVDTDSLFDGDSEEDTQYRNKKRTYKGKAKKSAIARTGGKGSEGKRFLASQSRCNI